MIHVPLPRRESETTALEPPTQTPPAHLWTDLRQMLTELEWFVTRDWTHIVSSPTIATAIIQRATRAALMAEDIRTDLIHSQPATMCPATGGQNSDHLRAYLAPTVTDRDPAAVTPQVTAIPVSVDQVTLYEFGQPKEHEHPLYVHHHVVNFCAAFYHEDQFIFARAHLQLLLTPTNHLNWLAGVRSAAVDQTHNPLPYVPDGTLFHTLGVGITQLICLHQTELIMKMKQGARFSQDYKLTGSVLPAGMAMTQATLPPTVERQRPEWLNAKS
ncbi:MAG: hypothetical protein OJF50_006633 [Nitrospira sp.]|nr:hypothetical protein [Nitrospira sp.]